MKHLKVLLLSLALVLTHYLLVKQQEVQVLLVLQDLLSSGVIAAIAAAVLAVAAIVDAQDGDKVTAARTYS